MINVILNFHKAYYLCNNVSFEKKKKIKAKICHCTFRHPSFNLHNLNRKQDKSLI